MIVYCSCVAILFTLKEDRVGKLLLDLLQPHAVLFVESQILVTTQNRNLLKSIVMWNTIMIVMSLQV